MTAVRYRIDAPPDRVFRAFTEPALLRQWWAPRGWVVREIALDPSPGGVLAMTIVTPQAAVIELHGTYREISAPGRISYTMEGTTGNDQTIVTIDLVADGGATHLTFSEVAAGEVAAGEVAAGEGATTPGRHEPGLLQALAQLEALLHEGFDVPAGPAD